MGLIAASALLTVVASLPPLLAFDVRMIEGRRVVLAYDCGQAAARTQGACQPYEDGFVRAGWAFRTTDNREAAYRGDSAMLHEAIVRNDASEVWLYSGGGHVAAGKGVARVLRAFNMPVRVPSGVLLSRSTSLGGVTFPPRREVVCASSCTIAFMGAPIRFVDPGAQFVVHAASAAADGLQDYHIELLRAGGFPGLARALQENACGSVLELGRIFQNSLRAAFRQGNAIEFRESASAEAITACSASRSYTEDDQRRDIAIYAVEGNIALQDIVMRVERSATRQALEFWYGRSSTAGPAFSLALDMITAMYSARIISAVPLTDTELVAMGYVTQQIETEPPE